MTWFLWAALAALMWGVAPILEKTGLKGATPLGGLFYRSVGVVIGLAVLAAFMVKPQEIKAIGPRSAAFLMLGGLLASFVGQICFYNALKIGEVSRAVPISGSYPFIAFILGILFFGESVSALKIAGAALIVFGVWLLKIG